MACLLFIVMTVLSADGGNQQAAANAPTSKHATTAIDDDHAYMIHLLSRRFCTTLRIHFCCCSISFLLFFSFHITATFPPVEYYTYLEPATCSSSFRWMGLLLYQYSKAFSTRDGEILHSIVARI